jgi:hypothetical protein
MLYIISIEPKIGRKQPKVVIMGKICIEKKANHELFSQEFRFNCPKLLISSALFLSFFFVSFFGTHNKIGRLGFGGCNFFSGARAP